MTYTKMFKFLFRSVRREREAFTSYILSTKKDFLLFLDKPTNKQSIIDKFQSDFNSVYDDLRTDPDTKAEFHHRIDELREILWENADSRKAEAEAELLNTISLRLVEDKISIITNIFISMMQLEMDRYIGTKNFIFDYAKDTSDFVNFI
jgi:hypothetical protein